MPTRISNPDTTFTEGYIALIAEDQEGLAGVLPPDYTGVYDIRFTPVVDLPHSALDITLGVSDPDAYYDLSGSDLQLVSWGNRSAVPTSGQDLVIAGTDTSGLLHIRTFADAGVRTDTYEAMEGGTLHLVSANASGVVLSDTPESSLPAAQAEAIADLKQHLPGWLPPNGLSAAEREQALSDATSITGQIDLSSLAVPGPDGVSLATLEILAGRSKGSPPCLRRRPRGQPSIPNLPAWMSHRPRLTMTWMPSRPR